LAEKEKWGQRTSKQNENQMEQKNEELPKDVYQSINPKKEVLTVDIFRTLGDFEHLTDEEAQEYVWSIRAFSNIVIEFLAEQRQKENNPDSPKMENPA
jgi:hypothetical protein